MAAFPRTVRPSRVGQFEFQGPLVSGTSGGKIETRGTGHVGGSWVEEFNVVDLTTAAGMAFLFDIGQLHDSGTNFTVVPETHLTALGTIATGVAGLVNGASQTGATLVTDGWASDGTIVKGSYIIVAGLSYPLFVSATATVVAGAANISVYPSIASGDAPADNAAVTLNGAMTCKFRDKPNVPKSITGIHLYTGLALRFNTDT